MAKRKKSTSSASSLGASLFDIDRVPPPEEPAPAKSGPTRYKDATDDHPEDVPTATEPAENAAVQPDDANGTPERPLTVAQLAVGIRDVLEACLANVWVVGEVSGLKRATSGHLYFDLKDRDAVVQCVMWKSAAGRVRGSIDNGTEVLVRGRVSFYEKSGRCQLYVEQMDERGLGALEIKFRQLKEQLQKEGLFDPERKQPLPLFPTTIGLVTSPTGAAVRDMIHVLSRRWPGLRIQLYGVRVQGTGAAQEIADAIAAFDRHRFGQVDVLIVGRGGGSVEDLWAFNEEVVARAIAACRIPVVSAVGHETDFSISDFVADVRAPTPSAAAEIVVPDRREVVRQVLTEAGRLQRAVDHALEMAAARLGRVAEHRFFKYPEEIAGQRAAQVDELADRLRTSLAERAERHRRRLHELERALLRLRPAARLAAQRGRLDVVVSRLDAAGRRTVERTVARVDTLGRRLEALSPLAVLERGYSITLDAASGKAVRSASAVAEGDELDTLLGKGERLRSRVTEP
jgi:exodeoxyribonuclease VII large subunit